MLNVPTSPYVVLFFDADNVQSRQEYILKFSHKQGNLFFCQAYGDWEQSPLLASQNKLVELGITCVQVDRIRKNATDEKILEDAYKILEAGKADIFIIASGDGHFSQLCRRIKDNGKTAICISNEGKASKKLQKACERFHFLEKVKDWFNKRI